MKSKTLQLKDLKYGTVIRRKKGIGKNSSNLWVKVQGLDGDIMMNVYDRGHWIFIEHKNWNDCKSWHKFEILFVPN